MRDPLPHDADAALETRDVGRGGSVEEDDAGELHANAVFHDGRDGDVIALDGEGEFEGQEGVNGVGLGSLGSFLAR